MLTGEGADELFAGYTYHHAYAGKARALADELTRALGTMHNINLQRVDRVTMAQGLEARTPFLDRDLIAFAQSIPASLKMKVTDPATGATTEKWILRMACEDLLPAEVIWRRKAQFDEGSGTVAALDRALAGLLGAPVDREREGALYQRLLRRRPKPRPCPGQRRHVDRRSRRGLIWASARLIEVFEVAPRGGANRYCQAAAGRRDGQHGHVQQGRRGSAVRAA